MSLWERLKLPLLGTMLFGGLLGNAVTVILIVIRLFRRDLENAVWLFPVSVVCFILFLVARALIVGHLKNKRPSSVSKR